MGRTQQVTGLLIVFLVMLGLGFAGWKLHRSAETGMCQVCGRMIHADMRTVAYVGDRREAFCCPTCALSAGAQAGKEVRFVQLADFSTGKPIQPADAYAVEGSDVVPCVRQHSMLNQDGQPVPVAFDRCSPSIIAFANRVMAERFAVEHGGKVAPFQKLITAAARAAVR